MPVGAEHRRAVRRLTALFAAAVAVSAVHYADNYANYDDFPTTDTLPTPSAAAVGLSWFAFTAVGAVGYVLYRGGRRIALATAALAAYSVSGLIGLGHYAAPAMAGAPWWRQAHVIADIASGIAILAFAGWSWRRWRAVRA